MVLTLVKLKRSRAAYQLQVNKNFDHAETIIQRPHNVEIDDINTIYANLEKYSITLTGLNEQIQEQLPDDEADDALDQEIAGALTVQERIQSVMTTLQRILKERTQQESTVRQAAGSNESDNGRHKARLPMLELPKFNGDPLQWSSFWDSFDSAVHSNNSLSEVNKFNYLRSLFSGTAADSIAGFAITNANYKVAVDLIRERFGQKQVIINAHVESLIGIPKATNSTAKLRAMYDECEVHIRGLQALGITSDTYGVIMSPIILSKVPEDIRLVITRRHGAAIGNLNQLRDLLKLEIEARELSGTTSVQHEQLKTTREPKPLFTTGSLMTTSKGRNDRREKAKSDGLCFNCLQKGPISIGCPDARGCRSCGRKHHTTLCLKSSWEKSTEGSLSTPALLSASSSVIMQTATTEVKDRYGKGHKVRILFDGGSQRSYMTAGLAKKLGLILAATIPLSISGFGSSKADTKTYNVVAGDYLCLDGSYRNISTVVVPRITLPLYRAPLTEDVRNQLHNFVLADKFDANQEWMNIDILIGMEHYWSLINGHTVKLSDSLAAISSAFGWLISGNTKEFSEDLLEDASAVLFCTATIPSSDNFLTKFWETEEMFSSESREQNDIVLERFNQNIELKENRYLVGFPWVEDEFALPSNYSLAYKRLQNLYKRLIREDIVKTYDDIIADQIRRDFIEPVNKPEDFEGILHYIAHHPVIRNDRATTKVRIVYDASAKQSRNDPCLNDCLYTGPNLLPEIPQLLLQFRIHQIGLLADIEKAFLQVGLRQEDRDATRFLWLKDHTKPYSSENVQVYRFKRVLFGAKSSPFLLAATIRYHLSNQQSAEAVKMLDSFYVDNLLTGTENIEEAKDFHTKAKDIFVEAGMNLREWTSNSPQVMSSIKLSDQACGTSHKVLGLVWDTHRDTLHVRAVPEMDPSSPVTKRSILRTISKVFDPIGMVSPIVILAKVMIQDLWKEQLEWDTPVPEQVLFNWRKLNSQLTKLDVLKIPRFKDFRKATHLHVFVDASVKAYSAVAFSKTDNNLPFFVCSKTRVAPVKSETIPRLELMAAVLGARLAKQLQTIYQELSKVTIWSDSQIVLAWLRKCPEQKQQTFVRNRVKFVQEHGYNFRYCPSVDNPADFPSRGTTVEILASSKLWWEGPSWLPKGETFWPVGVLYDGITEDKHEIVLQVSTGPSIPPQNVATFAPFGIDAKRFSSLQKLLRVTAVCKRFVNRLKKTPQTSGPISAEEYSIAKDMWIRHVQVDNFGHEFSLLNSRKSNAQIKAYRLFLDNGLLKCGSRFGRSALTITEESPILLPRCYFTDLMIADCHDRLFHQGVRHTLSTLRQQYWIPKGRVVVRSVLRQCKVCTRWEGPPFRLPESPNLPSARVTEAPAFTYVGCDFLGPVNLRDGAIVTKFYVCLFTCAVTRALHLEMTRNLTSDSFLMSLRRFISRRGVPREIISDNAKTFKLAKSTLDKLFHSLLLSDDVGSFTATQGIQWKFNIDRAPWWGGFFERLVGLVKRSVIKVVGKTTLNVEEFNTLLTEVEAILNTRPMTFLHRDTGEGIPLTPKDFLSQASYFGLPQNEIDPDPDYEVRESSTTKMLKLMAQRERLLNNYWKKWHHEYLSLLREYHQSIDKRRRKVERFPRVGEVVLIKDETSKRMNWKFGMIDSLFIGKDNKVRSALVKSKGKTFKRALPMLYPVESRDD